MKSPPVPANEEARLKLLRRLDILDTLEEQAYDDLTYLAAQICGVPAALVSLVDSGRQWFKSHYGISLRETPRDVSFCAHAILQEGLFLVEDCSKDDRFYDNPFVVEDPHIGFYAGEPLVLTDNLKVGTLCVIDYEPRTLTTDQRAALQALARQVSSQLELRLRLKELRRLDEAKDEFITMVNHELRTPLTSIKGALGLLKGQLVEHGAPENIRQLADISSRNSDRLLSIVNDILEVAKMEAGKLTIKRETVDVRALLEQAADLNAGICTARRCNIELCLGDDVRLLKIYGDESRLLQVMTNLISNAVKYTHEGDTIILGAEAKDSRKVRVSVTDHGPGVAVENQPYLFRRFSRFDQDGDRDAVPGTGLGLNICKHIIELHSGQIGYDIKPGKYTTFYFDVPVRPITQ